MMRRSLPFSISQLYLLIALLSLVAFTPAHAVNTQALKNIPVTQTTTDGKTFQGKLSITQLRLQGSQLVGDGFLQGQVDGRQVTQAFEAVPLTISHNSRTGGVVALQGPNEPGVCDILFLDIGPIFLDVLGLTIDLSEIVLDIDAVPGSGNLLGNLLCAVAGLLDNFNLNALLQSIIQNLLNAINQLL